MPVPNFHELKNSPGSIPADCRGTSLEELGIRENWLPEGVSLRTQREPFVERLSPYEIEKSLIKTPDYKKCIDQLLSTILAERFSSRWSRENTPVDCTDKYERHVRRSFTPIRDIGGYQVVKDNSYTGEYRQPLGVITTPYHTNYNYYSENQPIRKYDVFQLRTWAYPIYKYIHGRDSRYIHGRDCHPGRPYSYTKKYATTSHYTPPTMAPEVKSLTSRRGYSGYNYVASEQNFDVASKPWSLSNYRFWRSHVTTAPWYWSYYGRSGGRSGNRHYNSYHPPAYTSRLSTYWPSYY